ncbi:MAG TPA: TIGR03016 family PEP-CTERM system-associated outer membrane protein [Thiobacillus sp.]
MVLAFAPAAHALDWRLEPTLNLSATYTDNVHQSATDPEDALILSATPGFTLRSEGSRRVQATLQYGLTGVARFGGGDSDRFFHNLNAVGKAELVENFLFVDGSANISQQLISLLGSPADATINNSNRATVGTYSISPYIQKRFGSFANALVRYTHSAAIFENDVAPNANVDALAASLASGPRFGDLSWGLNYSIRKANRNGVDTTFERASATAGYALTRKFRVFGTVGEDRNDYLSATGTSGAFYSAGFGWSPTRRTSIEASAGERYFGRTYSLSGSHRTRVSNWNVSYAEDVSDTSQFMLTNGTVYDYFCPAPNGDTLVITHWQFTFPPGPDCIPFGGTPGPVFDLRNGVFIAKTLRGGVSWGISKVTYSLNLTDSKRLYTLVNAEDETQSLGASAAYRMTAQTTFNSTLTFVRTHVPAPLAVIAHDDDLITLSLGLNRRFSDKLSGALIFRRTQRDSNVAASNYEENSVTATANMRF